MKIASLIKPFHFERDMVTETKSSPELVKPLIFIEKEDLQSSTKVTAPQESLEFVPVDMGNKHLKKRDFNIVAKTNPYHIAKEFCEKIAMVVVDGIPFVYNRRFYENLPIPRLESLVIDVCCTDDDKRGRASFVKDVVFFLLRLSYLQHDSSLSDGRVISFSNGVLELQTGELLASDFKYRIFYGISANFLGFYEQQAYYFDSFLHSISGGDQALKTRILEMIGYCLAPDVKGKCFFVLQGVGNSGKSVLCTLMQMLLNPDATMTMNAHELSREFAVAELHGKKLILSPDLPDEPLDSKTVSRLKQLTGSDEVSSNVKFGAYTKFRSQAAIVLATNHPLLIKSPDDAFSDRAVVIPFRFAISRESRCLDLNEKLYAERDVIVSKAITAYMKLRQRDYRFSGDFRLNEVVDGGGGDSLDSKIFLFIRENLIVCEGGVVFAEDLHAAYVKSSGYIPINDFSQRFNRIAIEEFPVKKARKRRPGAPNAISCFIGIAWRDGEKGETFEF